MKTNILTAPIHIPTWLVCLSALTSQNYGRLNVGLVLSSALHHHYSCSTQSRSSPAHFLPSLAQPLLLSNSVSLQPCSFPLSLAQHQIQLASGCSLSAHGCSVSTLTKCCQVYAMSIGGSSFGTPQNSLDVTLHLPMALGVLEDPLWCCIASVLP
jgi:hypothetical protein